MFCELSPTRSARPLFVICWQLHIRAHPHFEGALRVYHHRNRKAHHYGSSSQGTIPPPAHVSNRHIFFGGVNQSFPMIWFSRRACSSPDAFLSTAPRRSRAFFTVGCRCLGQILCVPWWMDDFVAVHMQRRCEATYAARCAHVHRYPVGHACRNLLPQVLLYVEGVGGVSIGRVLGYGAPALCNQVQIQQVTTFQ